MPFDPFRHHRRSIRWRGYDYAANGVYYVTICTHRHGCLFGTVICDGIELNRAGEIVEKEWLRTESMRDRVCLDAYVIMPNHLHALLILQGEPPPLSAQRGRLYRRPDSLSSLLAGFKSAVTRQINALRQTPGSKVWQRNYYDRVIRNAGELYSKRQYILQNPARWYDDPEQRLLDDDGVQKW
jgi:REP element-mobilizing transposase RayT